VAAQPVRVLAQTHFPIRTPDDLVRLRQLTREQACAQGFNLIDQTKIVTAASELGRNALVHGGGGEVLLERLEGGLRRGLRLTFEDHGPGIANTELALSDGYSTGSGMGLGLGGAKRLCDDFELQSSPGQGTRVRIARWR
jgi:serine/threonine-protein kinase RsbT